MDMSVGDYAERLMAEEVNPQGALSSPSFNPTPSHLPGTVLDQAPDISKVEVPEDFITSVLSESTEDPVVEDQKVIVVPKEESIQENDLNLLLQEVKSLLEEVKMQLIETTTCGMGGTNQGGATTKEVEVEDPMDKILQKLKKKRRSTK